MDQRHEQFMADAAQLMSRRRAAAAPCPSRFCGQMAGAEGEHGGLSVRHRFWHTARHWGTACPAHTAENCGYPAPRRHRRRRARLRRRSERATLRTNAPSPAERLERHASCPSRWSARIQRVAGIGIRSATSQRPCSFLARRESGRGVGGVPKVWRGLQTRPPSALFRRALPAGFPGVSSRRTSTDRPCSRWATAESEAD